MVGTHRVYGVSVYLQWREFKDLFKHLLYIYAFIYIIYSFIHLLNTYYLLIYYLLV